MLAFTDNPVTEIADLSFAAYQEREGINQSLLKLYDKDEGGAPAKFLYAALHPEDRPNPSPAMEFGRGYHHFCLTPESFDDFYVIRTPEIEGELLAAAQAGQPKGKKSEKFSANLGTYKMWSAQHEREGRAVITQRDANTMEAMRAALLETDEYGQEFLSTLASSDPRRSGPRRKVSQLFEGAALEVSMFASFPLASGEKLQLKARLDMLPQGDAILDLKSARSAHERDFAKEVANKRLDIQAAFYTDICRAVGIPKKRFGFLAQDKHAPFLSVIHWMPDAWVNWGRISYRRLLLEVAESIRKNKWPGYQSGELMPPSWLIPTLEAAA